MAVSGDFWRFLDIDSLRGLCAVAKMPGAPLDHVQLLMLFETL